MTRRHFSIPIQYREYIKSFTPNADGSQITVVANFKGQEITKTFAFNWEQIDNFESLAKAYIDTEKTKRKIA